jgi:hypothetical protein
MRGITDFTDNGGGVGCWAVGSGVGGADGAHKTLGDSKKFQQWKFSRAPLRETVPISTPYSCAMIRASPHKGARSRQKPTRPLDRRVDRPLEPPEWKSANGRMLLPAARAVRIALTLAASFTMVAGRPSRVPSAFARASPAMTRSRRWRAQTRRTRQASETSHGRTAWTCLVPADAGKDGLPWHAAPAAPPIGPSATDPGGRVTMRRPCRRHAA